MNMEASNGSLIAVSFFFRFVQKGQTHTHAHPNRLGQIMLFGTWGDSQIAMFFYRSEPDSLDGGSYTTSANPGLLRFYK